MSNTNETFFKSAVQHSSQNRNKAGAVGITGLPALKKQGGLCMEGRLYSGQKCPICNGKLEHNVNRRGLFCLVHTEQQANSKFVVRFGRDITKRFKTYVDAERFLNGLRYEKDTGKFDVRDYQNGNQLGFETLALKWLEKEKNDVKPGTFKGYRHYINRAIEYWGQRNIKTIRYSDLEDFISSLKRQKNKVGVDKLSSKTTHNIITCLATFFKWVEDREEGKYTAPKMPVVKYELGWRTVITKQHQIDILNEVKRITYDYNPKIWLAIKWLATYVGIRPGEMIRVQEKDVNIDGTLFVRYKKEKEGRFIDLNPEDIEIVNSLPKGLPEQVFFRHEKVKGYKTGTPFGDNYLYKWWCKACDNLGIKGVDLYGGTKHSSVRSLKKDFSKEDIKQFGTGHKTNKAFERYYGDDVPSSSKIFLKAAEGLNDEVVEVIEDEIIEELEEGLEDGLMEELEEEIDSMTYEQTRRPEQHLNNIIRVDFVRKSLK